MIGDSLEETGFENVVTTPVVATMADRAVRMFPMLAGLNVVRTWSALRVMSQDGFPIYDQSATHPGAFLVDLPLRRHAGGKPRLRHRAADRRRTSCRRSSPLQCQEVPCSAGCLRRRAIPSPSRSTAKSRAGVRRRHRRGRAAFGRRRSLPHHARVGRQARALLHDGRVLRLPRHHRRRRQSPIRRDASEAPCAL